MPGTYSIYGLTLISEMDLPELGPPSEPLLDTPETVCVCLETNARPAVDSLPLAYTSPHRTPSGAPRLHIYRDEPGLLLCFAHIADFRVHPSSVTVMPAQDSDPAQVRQFLLGPALAMELELLGIPCLHASAVALQYPSALRPGPSRAHSGHASFPPALCPPALLGVGGAGGAVGFLGTSTGGKSVLASSFVEAGAALLTDDILPLRRQGDGFVGSPGYPQMKVWPEAARELLGDHWRELDRVIPSIEKRRLLVGSRWGTFCVVAQPLLALYVPVRVDGPGAQEIEIVPIAPSRALIELVRYSFCARPAQALGWQPRRLSFLTELVRSVPVRRLQYPSGFEHLPAVQASILQDMSQGS